MKRLISVQSGENKWLSNLIIHRQKIYFNLPSLRLRNHHRRYVKRTEGHNDGEQYSNVLWHYVAVAHVTAQQLWLSWEDLEKNKSVKIIS